ncbi:hypothetical protein HAZT_HAZT011845 [Hyalella azteca]|uniref:Uncharacterized protein n=1 Tax=Hyalella azteca TaxID=294128 RepID=A0A6A0GSM5_HYAAZ|nr:hypothetical protein HAZT_HAZT011845 [Hyalella azteca]
MAKHLVQAALAAVQVVGRAFVKAVRQEIAVYHYLVEQASQAAAARHGGGRQGAEHSATNSKLGMTLDEAKQILNVKELSKEQVQKNYEYLFNINDKAKGGSLYLQSKVSSA